MLSIAKMSSDGDAGSYDAGSYWLNLAREDYYLAGGEPPGRWIGQGAEALGLTMAGGQVVAEDLRAVLQGLDPDSRSALVQGAGPDHRPGWDFCFSAPKSVSVVWSQAPEDLRRALQAAQAKAVASALEHLERNAALSRRGHGGQEQERPAGIIAATFEHGTSREQDPQLHTHCLIANLAPRQDGSWGSLEPCEMYRHKMAAGAIYRAELATQVQTLGFQVERDGDSFAVAGVPAEICAAFSQRREQIEDALEEAGLDSARAAEVAALDTRRAKEARPRAELFEEWQTRARDLGWTPEILEAAQAATAEPRQMPTAAELLAALTAQASTVRAADVYRLLAVEGQGILDAAGIQQAVDEFLQHPDLIHLQAANGETRYTSREMLDLERGLAADAQARRGEARHQVTPAAMAAARAARTLTREQDRALTHIMGPDGVTCVQGMAGAGKSYMLGAARAAWEAGGYRVRARPWRARPPPGSRKAAASSPRPSTPCSRAWRPRLPQGPHRSWTPGPCSWWTRPAWSARARWPRSWSAPGRQARKSCWWAMRDSFSPSMRAARFAHSPRAWGRWRWMKSGGNAKAGPSRPCGTLPTAARPRDWPPTPSGACCTSRRTARRRSSPWPGLTAKA